jgi:hypothetical protein
MAGLFRGPDCVRRSTGRVRPAVFYRSKFEVSQKVYSLALEARVARKREVLDAWAAELRRIIGAAEEHPAQRLAA